MGFRCFNFEAPKILIYVTIMKGGIMMKDDREKSFFGEFLKWFFIWEFIGLIFRGIAYLVKMIFLAFKQLIWLIGIGIQKLTPIIKAKMLDFKNNYNTVYKPKIKMRGIQFMKFVSRVKKKVTKKISDFIRKWKLKRRLKAMKHKYSKEEEEKKSELRLRWKKTRYRFLEFYYKYELQLISVLVILIIITVLIIILRW